MSLPTLIGNTGEITSNFLMDDFTVYLMNTTATGGYVSTDFVVLGFTEPVKTLNKINEKFRKLAGIPQREIFVKTITKGMTMGFSLCNFNEDLMAELGEGTKSSLGSTGTRIAYGTDTSTTTYRTIRFVAIREDLVKYTIDVPKAEITLGGEQEVGGVDANAVIPLVVTAQFNPAANGTASLYVETFFAASIGATAVVPIGYA